VPVWLNVDPRSGVPLYLQLVEQVQHALEVGILQPGDALPTVRALAGELTIAPNTIVKAYGELERLGLIESRAGAGTTVSAGLDGSMRRQMLERLRGRLEQSLRDAIAGGVDEQTLRSWFETGLERTRAVPEAAAHPHGKDEHGHTDP
jgi:GntR family transcriptional regulator